MKKALFKLARSPIAGSFIGFAFAHLTALMPLSRLYEDADCILFLHPVPYWETHWLGVPKARIGRFLDVHSANDWCCILAILRSLSQLRATHNIEQSTTLVNGGIYQDVPQLHFHLAQGATKHGDAWRGQSYFEAEDGADVVRLNEVVAWRNRQAERAFSWQISAENTAALHNINWENSAETNTLIDLLKLSQQLVDKEQPHGWTLQFHHDKANPDRRLIAHLVGEFKS